MEPTEPDCASRVPDQPPLPQNASQNVSAPYDPMDASTFIAPSSLPTPSIVVEFCDRCRWWGNAHIQSFTLDTYVGNRRLHRATWTATELFLTFPPPALKSIQIMPLNSDETSGRFRVWLVSQDKPALLWDRKIEGGFPELKVLKQRIRDKVQPEKSLGHSDVSK